MTFITEQQQDEYAKAWIELINQEQMKPKRIRRTGRGGKPSTWPKYFNLLERHKALTSSDFAAILGINLDAATQSLYNYQRKGLIAVVDRIDGITIWGLPQ